MFKKKTVFILGAGASWHYGYPTGEELVKMARKKAEELIKEYENPTLPPIDFHNASFQPQHYQGENIKCLMQQIELIQKKLAEANPLVIDDFLGRNKDIADIGKLLIAMVLLECEKTAQIRSGKIDEATKMDTGVGDWVRHVVQQLTVDCRKSKDEKEDPKYLLENDVKFVTFNYDLSLERRLHTALSNYQWFAEGGYVDTFFDPGRFYHVYGQLYDFDPAYPDGPKKQYIDLDVFPLTAKIDRAWDSSLALGNDGKPRLRTIAPDEKTAAPEIVKAIAEAEYLYILGYGFDRRNNELLVLGNRPEGAPRQFVRFTNYGNHNKVSKQVAHVYHNNTPDALTGERYYAIPSLQQYKYTYSCEKSIKSVYDALAEDFDWPD